MTPSEILKLCEKATPGPWSWNPADYRDDICPVKSGRTIICDTGYSGKVATDKATAAYIAALDPATVRDLVRDAMRCAELDALINTPETADFLDGVRREAAHQVQRWGYAHDRSKSAENWFWLVGYLAGKALRSAITGDREKAKHHCISSAAALFNWHTAITHDTTGAGIGQDDNLRAKNPKDAQAAIDAAQGE